jgi:putative phosphoribosyl transferase
MSAAVDRFSDRLAAGERLAHAVRRLNLSPPLVVLALPRGGVPAGFEVARALGAPLDVLLVRKIGMPGQPELAIGAIATGDVIVHEPAGGSADSPDAATFAKLVLEQRAQLREHESLFRGGLAPLELRGKTAVLVDDGIATGATMLAAVRAARRAGASRVIAAAPVAADEAADLLGHEADRLAILKIPRLMQAVAEWYVDFSQVSDAQVQELLRRSRAAAGP